MSSSLCLIGHPLGHSLSPFLHRRLMARSGVNGDYTLREIDPAAFSEDVPCLLNTVNGCNVTIPYKQAIVPFLDRLEGKAALYQTVNTVAVTADGTVGYNTDVDGFLQALRHADIPLQGRVRLLGTGGAATVFACEAALAGCEVTIHKPRNLQAAQTLCARVRTVAPHAVCRIATEDDGDAVDLLLNATPVGMHPHTDACPADERLLARCAAVFDAIYNPRTTRLLECAAASGAKTAGGMAMLAWQAAAAQTIWHGVTFKESDMDALIEDAYRELEVQFA